jgi:hypothetical protein
VTISSFGRSKAIRFRSLLRLIQEHLRALRRGYKHWRLPYDWPQQHSPIGSFPSGQNFLLKYFKEHKEGPGIWKWNHYFEIYERHFGRFRGQEVHLLEIGVYSGGSLGMWREYFGPRCKVYGVDIEPSCKAYEGESVRVFIGDQADRNLWQRVKQEVPVLDIVIDDGGHLAEQQIVTLEELLPHLRAGGVYLCEDVFMVFNEFSSYVHGLAQNLNALDLEQNVDDNERRLVCKVNSLQSAIGSIHLYPFVTLIERSVESVSEFVNPKRGTQWEPFLK